jgi:hypothetical protein
MGVLGLIMVHLYYDFVLNAQDVYGCLKGSARFRVDDGACLL